MSSLPRTSGIYRITCTANGKFYIGSSANMLKRQQQHCSKLRKGTHGNQHLQSAWKKYGENAFSFDVVEICDCDALLDREQHYLDLFHAYDSSVGFNIGIKAGGAMFGRPLSESARAKVSQALKAYYSTDEGRANKIAASTGRVMTETTRSKIRASNVGKVRSGITRERVRLANIGRKASKATREKMRISQAGKKMSPESIAKTINGKEKRFIVTSPSGVEIEIKGLAKFCREHGLNRGNMMSVAAGMRSHNHGWKCRYA